MYRNQRGIATITVLEIIGAFLAISAGIYFGLVRQYTAGPSPEASSDRQTYQDPTYGFRLEHPAAWHSERCSDRGPLDEIYILVSIGDAPRLVICNSDAPLEGYINVSVFPGTPDTEWTDITLQNLDDGKKTNVVVDGHPAVRVEGTTRPSEGPGPQPGLRHIFVLTPKDNLVYQFIFTGKAEHAGLFDQSLATFRFPEIPSVPPVGCHWRQVQCITTPCDPQLICPSETPDTAY